MWEQMAKLVGEGVGSCNKHFLVRPLLNKKGHFHAFDLIINKSCKQKTKKKIQSTLLEDMQTLFNVQINFFRIRAASEFINVSLYYI